MRFLSTELNLGILCYIVLNCRLLNGIYTAAIEAVQTAIRIYAATLSVHQVWSCGET